MSKFVYTFIQSMSPHEKAYFKNQTLKSGDKSKNYLFLFDALVSMPEYDRNALAAIFKPYKMGKYLGSEMNYLYNIILKNMVLYYIESNTERNIRKSMLFIDILMEKNYRNAALKILNKAKNQALKYEYLSILLKLLQMEIEILFQQGILGFTKKLKELELESDKIILQIKNFNELRLLRELVRELWFDYGFLTEVNSHVEIFEHKILFDSDSAISLKARHHWHYCVAMRHYIIRDFEKSKSAFGEGLKFLDLHHDLFQNQSRLPFISNHLLSCAMHKDLVSFNDMMQKLELIILDSKDKTYLFYIKYSRQLELHYRMGGMPNSEVDIDEIEMFLSQSNHLLQESQYNYMYFLLVRALVISEKYEKALGFRHIWLSKKILGYYMVTFKLISLIIFYEVKYNELLDSEISNTERLIRKTENQKLVAKEVITFFKRIKKEDKNAANLLTNLIHRLDSFEDIKSKNGQKNYDLFDYRIWARKVLIRLK